MLLSLKQWFLAPLRRVVQAVSLLLLHSSWGPELKSFCLPVMNCHSCALSWFACPIGVYVHYAGYRLFPFLAVGTVLIIGVFLGRFLCGWVCPFGFLQDLLHKIPSPKFRVPRWTAAIKYVVLVVMVFAIPLALGAETPWSFCRFCPTSAIQVTLPAMLTGGAFSMNGFTIAKLVILVGVLTLVVFSSRAFCKVLCPIGALLAPLNYLSFWRVKPIGPACISCKRCDRACPTDAAPAGRMLRSVPPNRAAECVTCHDCRVVCPVRKTSDDEQA